MQRWGAAAQTSVPETDRRSFQASALTILLLAVAGAGVGVLLALALDHEGRAVAVLAGAGEVAGVAVGTAWALRPWRQRRALSVDEAAPSPGPLDDAPVVPVAPIGAEDDADSVAIAPAPVSTDPAPDSTASSATSESEPDVMTGPEPAAEPALETSETGATDSGDEDSDSDQKEAGGALTAEPVVEADPMAEEEPAADEEPGVEEEPVAEEEPAADEEPVVEEQPGVEEDLVTEAESPPTAEETPPAVLPMAALRDMLGFEAPIMGRVLRSEPQAAFADVFGQVRSVAKHARVILCTATDADSFGELASGLAEAVSDTRHEVIVLQTREEPAEVAHLADKRHLGQLLRRLLRENEYVVIDGPAVGTPLATALVAVADVVLVESPHRTPRDVLAALVAKVDPKRWLRRSRPVGIVLIRD